MHTCIHTYVHTYMRTRIQTLTYIHVFFLFFFTLSLHGIPAHWKRKLNLNCVSLRNLQLNLIYLKRNRIKIRVQFPFCCNSLSFSFLFSFFVFKNTHTLAIKRNDIVSRHSSNSIHSKFCFHKPLDIKIKIRNIRRVTKILNFIMLNNWTIIKVWTNRTKYLHG